MERRLRCGSRARARLRVDPSGVSETLDRQQNQTGFIRTIYGFDLTFGLELSCRGGRVREVFLRGSPDPLKGGC